MENAASQPLILKLYRSPIGKKLITGGTGLALATFVLVHMVGNLLLFVSHEAYNAYAHHLAAMGPLLWLVESVLLAGVLLHAAVGIQIFWGQRRSRSENYATYRSKGQPSLQSFSSRTMIVTGTVLGSFLVLHLANFKFGPYYTTQLDGQAVRDLARLVIAKFQNPLYAFSYSGVVLLLGVHLRHGIWSALQSLGLMHQAVRFTVYGLSLGLAIAIAAGFMILPLAVYFGLLT
ncbi:MAG: succinate dehydrogenase cytochrome b subunit [Leptolyngbyaceae cyanobacterium]